MKVLLIEPDTKLANIYRAALEQAGHVVLHAAYAQDAVHEADEIHPDMVILELQLAGHNGIEFIYEFRSYSEWQNVPIILLTMVAPHALGITTEMFQRLGIIDCLYKPATNLRKLLNAVGEA
jgi:DNA-binding response OmpR family regulator